jgi:NAD-dependent deacetylase
VLYGESIDNEAFSQAEEAIYTADVLIVGGTSLTVFPAASLVDEFVGEHLIIINKSPTPYDEYAEYVIREPISEVMEELVD